MLITLTGDNTFAIAEAEQQIINAFTAKFGQVNIERADANELHPSALPSLLLGGTLFAPSRLIILRQVANNKFIHDSLADYLQKIPQGNTVVISDSGLDKRTKLYKFLKTTPGFKELKNLNESQLQKWIIARAASAESKIEPGAAQFLMDRTGHNQWRLANEIDKLAAGRAEITQEAASQLVEPVAESTAFEVLDAALGGRQAEAAKLLRGLSGQEDPFRFFGLLASQVHAIALAAGAGGRSAEEISKDSGIHSFVIRKAMALARGLKNPDAANMCALVANLDMQLKSSSANPWDLIGICLQRLGTQVG